MNITGTQTPSGTNMFDLLAMRMDYLKQRQAVVAQNVSNADLPGYKAHDLQSFSTALDQQLGRGVRGAHITPVNVAVTNAGHINVATTTGGNNFGSNKPAVTYETLPSGNSVVLEEQMMKIAQIGNDYNLATNLYRDMGSMMKLAIGHSNS